MQPVVKEVSDQRITFTRPLLDSDFTQFGQLVMRVMKARGILCSAKGSTLYGFEQPPSQLFTVATLHAALKEMIRTPLGLITSCHTDTHSRTGEVLVRTKRPLSMADESAIARLLDTCNLPAKVHNYGNDQDYTLKIHVRARPGRRIADEVSDVQSCIKQALELRVKL